MRRVHYAWIVAAVGFVTLITTAGFRSTSGVLIVPLQDEFGWSRATLGFAVFVNLMLFGLGGPFAAALAERYGLKRVMIGALLAVSVGSSLTIFMSAPWQLVLLWGVVNGIATGAISVPLAALIANRWFVRRRGLVTGILTASNATGQLIFLPALAWIVQSYGWRYAAVTVAVVAIGIVLPLVALLMRDRPEDSASSPTAPTSPIRRRRAATRSAAPSQGLLDARHSNDVLAPHRQLLHLRRVDDRPDRDAPDPGRARPRHRRGPGGVAARADRRLRHRRHDLLGLADRPLRPTPAARLVLRACAG